MLITCPVCEYPKARLRYRVKDRFFQTSQDLIPLYGCSSCGLLFQREEERPTDLASIYPPGYWWEPSGTVGQMEDRYRNWMVSRDQLRFTLSVAAASPPCRLLDIGCGAGTFLQLALKAGFDAYGLDSSPEAVRVASEDLRGRIVAGSEQELIERGEQFDLITLFHCLEHIPNPFSYLKTLRKLLRKPGGLIVQVPNRNSLQAKMLGPRWYGLDCPRHLYNYTTFSLLHLLGRAGYRIQRTRHFSLRDNAAALVSSLFPRLDPMSQRVLLRRRSGRSHSKLLTLKEALYFNLLVLAQPLAWLEAGVGRGATVTVYATLE